MAVVAQFIITLDNEKGVGVSGPIHEKILFYGLCHEAMSLVRAHQPPLVQPATVVPDKPIGLNGSGLRIVK